MEDLIFDVVVALGSGLLGFFIASAIEKYCKKACEWFESLWDSLSRQLRAVGYLVRRGKRLIKEFYVQLISGEVEQYVQHNDEGIEYKPEELPEEVKKALNKSDYVPIWAKNIE